MARKKLDTPKPKSVQDLLAAADEAKQIRDYQTNPSVIALDVENAARFITRILVTGLVLGFAFTIVNVQAFVADGAQPDEIKWWAAWAMEPMLVLIVVSLLRAQAVMSRHGVRSGPWLKATLFLAGFATYVMNTWESWQALDRTGIVLHSIAPIIVVCATEVLTEVRERLAEAAQMAAASQHATQALAASTQAALTVHAPSPFAAPAAAPAGQKTGAEAGSETGTGAGTVTGNGRRAASGGAAATKPAKTSRGNSVDGGNGNQTGKRATVNDFADTAVAAYEPGTTGVDYRWVMEKSKCSKPTAYKVLDRLRAVLPEDAFAQASQPQDADPAGNRPVNPPTEDTGKPGSQPVRSAGNEPAGQPGSHPDSRPGTEPDPGPVKDLPGAGSQAANDAENAVHEPSELAVA